ncbi:MAG: protease inhibitor I42 family protein [Victivallales bacterium]|nr:protease inhibitor I42 family protein [Victivallales bacterium]
MFQNKQNFNRLFQRILLILILLSVVLTINSCALFTESRRINLAGESNGKTIKAEVGDTITVNLAGNPETGCAWILKKYDEKKIKFLSVQYKKSKSEPNKSQWQWISRFKVIKTGESKIEFVYKHPWEENKQSFENYYIIISAKK